MARAPESDGRAGPPEGEAGSAHLSHRAFLRSVSGQSILTLVSRLLGLVREQLRAAFLGTGLASDAFGLAVMLPNLFRRLLGEGQMTAAFLPTLVERIRQDSHAEVRRFVSGFLGVFSLVVTGVVILGELLTPWIVRTFFGEMAAHEAGAELTIGLTRLMFPYLGCVTLAAILQAALQAHRLFWPGAATPILLNLCIIGAALLLRGLFADPSWAFATGFVLGGVVQIAFQVPFFLKKGFSLLPRWGARDPHVRRVFRIFAPALFAGGIYQVNTFVAQVVASSLGKGRISALQYSVRLQELVLGVFVVSVTTVLLPTLSAQVDAEGHGSRSAARTLSMAGRLLALVTLPATVGLILLGEPIVRLLFEFGHFSFHSTQLVVTALTFHALGLYPIALSRNLTQAFYAQKDLKTPTIIAFGVMLAHLGLCYALSPSLDHGGIALAGSLAALLTAVPMVPLLHQRGIQVVDRAFWLGLLRTSGATALMGLCVWALSSALDLGSAEGGRPLLLAKLCTVVLAGCAVFLTGLVVLRQRDALRVLRALRRRRSR